MLAPFSALAQFPYITQTEKMAEKSKRWSRVETVYLINAMEDLKIKWSDGRKHKNAELFKTVTVFTSGNRDDVNILFTFIQSEAFPAPNLTMTQKHQNKEFLSVIPSRNYDFTCKHARKTLLPNDFIQKFLIQN